MEKPTGRRNLHNRPPLSGWVCVYHTPSFIIIIIIMKLSYRQSFG